MPAPRRSESAAGGAMQRVFAWPYRGILAFLLWTGIRPWQLTLLSLALTAVTGILIVIGQWLAAGIVLIFAGAADVFAGSGARPRGATRRGVLGFGARPHLRHDPVLLPVLAPRCRRTDPRGRARARDARGEHGGESCPSRGRGRRRDAH